MKKVLFFLAAVVIVASGCKKEDPQVLKGMAIKKITVVGFPSLDGNVTWDLLSPNPDIFIEFSKENSPFYTTSHYADATNNDQYSWSDFVYLDDLEQSYTITLYDYDDVLPHDWMGAVSFFVIDQPTTANTLTFNNGPFQFIAEVEFYY